MSYTALYRKYRPQNFDDVKGQDHIVKTIRNQIKAERIGHAYLFCGTRGTGKTTMAKIFARAVNCERPINGSPCGECDTCKSIAAGNSLNVIEIDAASNNGVDNIRDIREEVEYPPTQGRYKVYIIDEAHQITPQAFNALLKTLEEPPSYVIFILATTEANKIPVTILSRCQRYDFHRISVDTIMERLQELATNERLDAEEKALRYIAKSADGAMRDALSLLDQCVAFYMDQKLTYDHVLEILGAADTELYSSLLRAMNNLNVPLAIHQVERLVTEGRDLSQFVNDFTWYLRNLLLLQSSEDMEDVLDMSSENLAALKEECEMLSGNELIRWIYIFSELSNKIRYSMQKRILLEIAIIKICNPSMEKGADSLESRVANLEKQVEKGITVRKPQEEIFTSKENEKRQKATIPKAIPEDIQQVVKNWRSIVPRMPGLTKTYMQQAHLSLGNDDTLLIVLEDSIGAGLMSKEEHLGEIQKIISETIGKEVNVQVQAAQKSQPFEETYVDLSEIIHADIEIEDEEDEEQI